jgi:5-methylcytosine-specific restriction endonuclease McrA
VTGAQPRDAQATAPARVTGAQSRDAQTTAPARVSAAKGNGRGRHIPAAVARAVWARDGERCVYVDDRGQRCRETRSLELHHRRAQALGGPSTGDNLEVRCRAHNLLAAEEDFGRQHMDVRRGATAAPRWSG